MNLKTKKELSAKTFGVGKKRIVFVHSRKEEIKEAITKQDIRELKASGAILIKEVGGRKVVVKRTRKRGPGKIKKKINVRKRTYVIMTRKLRGYVNELKKQGLLAMEEVKEIRKKIRNRDFKSKANLKIYIGENKK